MKRHSSAWVVFTMLAAASAAHAQGGPAVVVMPVPFSPSNLTDPHTVISGVPATLGATVNLNGSTDSYTYSWNFGDGSPATAPVAVTNVYNLAGTYTYTAAAGTTYTAVLTVTDTTTPATYTGKYYVIVQGNTLTSRVNVAVDNGLWYLHETMWRSDSSQVPAAGTLQQGNNNNSDDIRKRAQAAPIPLGGWDTLVFNCPTVNGSANSCAGAAGIDATNTQAFEVSGHLETGPSVDPYTDDVARGLARMMYFLVPFANNADGAKTIGYNPAIQASRCSDGSVPTYNGNNAPTCTAPATVILYNQGATSCPSASCTFAFDGNNNGQMLIEGEDDSFPFCRDYEGSSTASTCTMGNSQDPGYQSGMLLTALVASGNMNGVARTGVAPVMGGLPGVLGQTYQNIVQDIADGIGYCQYYGDALNSNGYGYDNGGGWEYYCAGTSSDASLYDDNSISQWNAIALIAASRGFGIAIPPIVTDTNQVWMVWDQNVTPPLCTGQTPSTCVAGQYGYDAWDDPLWGPWAVTPSGMVQMAMDGVGRTAAGVPDQRWNMAESNYHDHFCNGSQGYSAYSNAYYSPRFYTYGMFSFTKAMEQHDPLGVLTPITFLTDQPSGTNPIDWYGGLSSANGGTSPCDGVAQTLVARQNSDGSWYGVDSTSEQYPFETAWSVQMLQKTSFTACVTNLSGTGQAGDTVNLTWTGIQSAGSYTIQRSTTNGGPYTNVATVAATSFQDSNSTGLVGGDTYFYVVQPLNSDSRAICTSNQATVEVPSGGGNGGLTLTGADGGVVTFGNSVSVSLAASGGTQPYTWQPVASPLPMGVSVSGSGVVSSNGTTPPGNYAIGVKITDSETPPASATAAATFSVFGLTNTSLPAGVAFSPYSAAVSAAGGRQPYTFSFSFLPPGLSGNSSGLITGAVTAPGTWNITINAKEAGGLSVSAPATLVFTTPPPLSVSGTLPAGNVNTPYSAGLSGSGGAPPYTWTLTGTGALPAGLSLEASGTILGVPTASGTFNFGVQATDVTGATAVGAASITIAAAPLTLIPPAPFTQGVANVQYPMQSITATGGVPPYTFSLAQGSLLPAGLTLNANGTVTGTPTVSSPIPFQFTVIVTDSSVSNAAVAAPAARSRIPRSLARVALPSPKAATGMATLSMTINPFSANDIMLGAESLSFSLAAGSAALPPSQNVSVVSTGTPLTWTATPSVGWLNATATAGTPGTVTVSLNTAAMNLVPSATPYTANVVVACSNATPCPNSPQTISVSLVVSVVPPQLSVPTNLISFNTPASNPQLQSQGLTVQNIGGGSIGIGGGHDAPSCAASWCTVTNVPNAVAAGSPATLSVNADPTGLAAGFYRTAVSLKTSAGTASVPVTLFIATENSMTLQPAGTVFQSDFGSSGDTIPAGGQNSFLVDVVGNNTVNWTASVLPGASWLSLGTASGTSTSTQPGTVSFSINKNNLPSGSYYGTIQVNAPGLVDTPLNFEVVLNVSPVNVLMAPAPSPAGLLYLSAAGTQPPAQTVQVMNNQSGSATLSVAASASNNGTWLTATGPAGPVASGTMAPVLVSVNPSNLNAGTYYGSVTLSWVGSALESTVNVTLLVPLASQAVQQDRPDAVSSAAPGGTCTPTQMVTAPMSLVNNFSTPAGWPTPLAVALLDNCGNFLNNGQVVATFTNGDPVLPLTLANPATGLYSGTWTPQRTGSQVTVNARSSAPGFAAVTTQLVGAVPPNSAPILTPNGTLNLFNPLPAAALAPGTLVQISGTGLAASAMSAPAAGPLPTTLNGTQVTVGGIFAPLQSVSPGTITAQVPFELMPNMQYDVVVSANGALTTPAQIQVSGTDPGVATAMSGMLTATHLDGTAISSTSPAAPGEYIVLTAVGLGLTNLPVADGAPGPSSPLANALDMPSITLNNESVPILFAGLQPGTVGVYQINIQVPADAVAGNLTLVLSQDGNPANSAILPVN